MKEKHYYWTGLSLITLTASLAGIVIQKSHVTGICIIGSYLAFLKGVKVARLRGKTKRSKITNSLTGNLIEFLAIFSAVFFIEAWVVVFSAVSIGFREAFKQELQRKLHEIKTEIFGRTERIILISLTFIGSFLNEYLMIYGFLTAGSMALFEVGRQITVYFRE